MSHDPKRYVPGDVLIDMIEHLRRETQRFVDIVPPNTVACVLETLANEYRQREA